MQNGHIACQMAHEKEEKNRDGKLTEEKGTHHMEHVCFKCSEGEVMYCDFYNRTTFRHVNGIKTIFKGGKSNVHKKTNLYTEYIQ